MKVKALKGIRDILALESYLWYHIESLCREVFKTYGYHEIRLPIIEATDVFIRSIGETTDIVEKEMYTFQDKGDRSVTLRPEGTASFVRAFVEHHLYTEPLPQKYYYFGPMFRYERPQAGRQRQFYQIGIEALGVKDPKLDAEVISMLKTLFEKIGLKDTIFELTSIGCSQCRPNYGSALKNFLKNRLSLFCEDCQRRYEINPLRILDCKVKPCIEARQGSPSITDFLCSDCSKHFERLRDYLNLLKIPYTLNPNLVRGLDYYTKTAFEVTSESLGAQNAVAAGGRYDGLVEEFGGPPTPGIGFAIGVERIASLIKNSFTGQECHDLFICPLGHEASDKTLIFAEELRAKGLWVETGYEGASLRSQMRRANRIGARYVIVIGEDEIKKGEVKLKDMIGKYETTVDMDKICETLIKKLS